MSTAAWDWTKIKTLATGDAAIQAISDGSFYIELAEIEVIEVHWGKRFNLGRAYLALHYAATSPGAKAIKAGPITQETIEGIARTRQAKVDTSSPAPWDATEYGRQYRGVARIVGRTLNRF